MNTTRLFILRCCLFCLMTNSVAGEIRSTNNKDGPVLVMTRDLVFGADGEEDHTIWGSPSTSIAVDDKGMIYVGDSAGRSILIFDDQGVFVRSLAGPGEGPGELWDLAAFRIFADGTAATMEKRAGSTIARWQRFDKNLKYASSYEGNLILEGPVLSPTGNVFAAFYVVPDRKSKTMAYRTALFDMNMIPIRVFTDERGPLPDRSKFNDPGYWSERLGANLARAYKGFEVFGFDDRGRLYSAKTSKYEVTRWSLDGKKPEQVFKRNYKPIPNTDEQINAKMDSLTEQLMETPGLAEFVTPAVLRKAVVLSDPPVVKNPIYGLLVMESDHVLVVHDLDLVTGESTADIFAPHGSWLGQITLPDNALVRPYAGIYLPRMVFRNNHAYTIQTDQDGDNRVVRYKLAWR